MNWLKSLLANAPGSIKGQIDLSELWKAIATAIGGSGLLGLLIAALTAVSNNLALILPNPVIAGLVSLVLGLILDLLRRQSAGVTPAQLPAGSTVNTPGTFVPRAISADRVATLPTSGPSDVTPGSVHWG